MSPSRIVQRQRGFSLIELLVGLVVGLIASAAIIQTLGSYEAQKRTTAAGSEAQENGLVALAQLQQDVHNAGAGLSDPWAFDCVRARTFSFSSLAAGPIPNFTFAPVVVTTTALTTASDTIEINSGDLLGGLPSFTTASQTASTDDLTVSRLDNFAVGDVMIVMQAGDTGDCAVMQVSATTLATHTIKHDQSIGIYNVNGSSGAGWPNFTTGSRVMNPKQIASRTYRIVNGNLELVQSILGLTPSAVTYSLVHNVVFMKAQYGVAPVGGNQSVNQWVSANGDFDADTLPDHPEHRKRIKAVRIAVVTRSAKMEPANVTSPCTNVSGQVNNGPCAWRDSATSPAPIIDLSADPDWQRYRYKVYQTVVPLRNVLWGNV